MPLRRDSQPRAWRQATLVAIVLFWLLDLLALRAGAPDPLDDSWEYGVVARALLAGHGMRTEVIHPPLWSMRDALGTVPVLVHGPLLPVLIAPALALFGPGMLDHLAWLSALFAILAAGATFALGSRLLSPPVGSAAALLFTLSPLTLRAVHHDIALVLGAWLLVLAVDQILRTRPHAVRAGVCIGLGALVRPEFLYAAPLLGIAATGARMRFLAIVAVCVAPWGWHGFVHAGSPFFNLSSYLLIGYWQSRPGLSVMRDFALTPAAWGSALTATLPELPGKWWEFAPHACKRLLTAPTGATGWLAPFGAFAALLDPRTARLAAVSLALALVPLAIMTVTLYDPRYLVPFLPLLTLGVARGASELASAMPAWLRAPRAWMGMLLLLALPSIGPALNDAWRDGQAQRERLRVERAALRSLVLPAAPRGTALYSDTPDFVAWTLHRPVIWVSLAEYLALPLPAAGTSAGIRPVRTPDDGVVFHGQEGRDGIALAGRIGDWLGAAPSRAPAAPAADSTRSR